ncbi:MAG: rhodanese-like domain-containing protein [Syntrophales bacterium]
MNERDRHFLRMAVPGFRGLRTAGLILVALLFAMPGSSLAAAAVGAGPPTISPVDLSRLLREGGATALNVMSRLECMDGRIPGSVCPSAGDPAAQLPGLAPDRNRPLVLYCGIGECPQSDSYAMAARSLGYTKLLLLKGGMAAWKEAGFAIESPGRIPRKPRPAVRPAVLKGWLDQGRPLTVLDIRETRSFREGRIGEAVNIPLEELHERYQEIPLDKPLLVVDDRGERSFLAASYLVRKGIEAERLSGGMRQWQAYLAKESKSRGK